MHRLPARIPVGVNWLVQQSRVLIHASFEIVGMDMLVDTYRKDHWVGASGSCRALVTSYPTLRAMVSGPESKFPARLVSNLSDHHPLPPVLALLPGVELTECPLGNCHFGLSR